MRKISEKTIITALIDFKFIGYFGNYFTSFSIQERNYIADELKDRGYVTQRMKITKEGDKVIKRNLDLLQH